MAEDISNKEVAKAVVDSTAKQTTSLVKAIDSVQKEQGIITAETLKLPSLAENLKKQPGLALNILGQRMYAKKRHQDAVELKKEIEESNKGKKETDEQQVTATQQVVQQQKQANTVTFKLPAMAKQILAAGAKSAEAARKRHAALVKIYGAQSTGITGIMNASRSLIALQPKPSQKTEDDRKQGFLAKKRDAMWASMKKSLKGMTTGIVKAGKVSIMGIIGVAALFSLIKFLESDKWKEWKKKLIPALTDGLNWLGDMFKGIGEWFGEAHDYWTNPERQKILKDASDGIKLIVGGIGSLLKGGLDGLVMFEAGIKDIWLRITGGARGHPAEREGNSDNLLGAVGSVGLGFAKVLGGLVTLLVLLTPFRFFGVGKLAGGILAVMGKKIAWPILTFIASKFGVLWKSLKSFKTGVTTTTTAATPPPGFFKKLSTSIAGMWTSLKTNVSKVLGLTKPPVKPPVKVPQMGGGMRTGPPQGGSSYVDKFMRGARAPTPPTGVRGPWGAKGPGMGGLSRVSKVAGPAVGKSVARIIGKNVLKTALRASPLIGVVIGGMEAAQRVMSGDFVGAGLALGAGVAAMLPLGGTAVSLGLSGGLLAHDVARMKGGEDYISKLGMDGEKITEAAIEKIKITGRGQRRGRSRGGDQTNVISNQTVNQVNIKPTEDQNAALALLFANN